MERWRTLREEDEERERARERSLQAERWARRMDRSALKEREAS